MSTKLTIAEVAFVQYEESVGSEQCIAGDSVAGKVAKRAERMEFDTATRLLEIDIRGRTVLIPAERVARMFTSPRPARGERGAKAAAAPSVPVETQPQTDGAGQIRKHKVLPKAG